MNKALAGVIGLVLIITATVAYAYLFMEQVPAIEITTAKIAAFNIQIFGKTKTKKTEESLILF